MALDSLPMLDEFLAEDGHDCVLQRIGSGVTVDQAVTVRAFPRRFAIEQIGSNGITEQHSMVVLSPTQIIAANWTSGRPAYEDRRVPMKGNRIVIAGRVRNVEAAVGLYEGAELVRIELRVL